MDETLDLVHAKDTKERMAGFECLHELLEVSRKTDTDSKVTSLVDICLDLPREQFSSFSQCFTGSGLSRRALERELETPLQCPCLHFSLEYRKASSRSIAKQNMKFLVVVVSRGLNQQRNQIVDAVVIVRILDAALVVLVFDCADS